MNRTIIAEGKFLRVIKEGHWEYVERVNANGAVMVIAETDEHEMILIEEYRYPLHANTIGLPAGISGDEGEETQLTSAKRELLEETGYEAREWVYLFDGPSSPGLATEMVSFFLASKLTRKQEGGGVGNEDITVHKIPREHVENWLREQASQGKMIDPRIFAGLYFLNSRL